MEVRPHSIEKTIQSDLSGHMDNDFGLERAELEMILSMKAQENIAFETALPSALTSSGNEWLFDFPADRFPLPAKSVAAICLHAGEHRKYCYVCDMPDGNGFCVLDERDINDSYIEFVKSYATVARALEPFMARSRDEKIH